MSSGFPTLENSHENICLFTVQFMAQFGSARG